MLLEVLHVLERSRTNTYATSGEDIMDYFSLSLVTAIPQKRLYPSFTTLYIYIYSRRIRTRSSDCVRGKSFSPPRFWTGNEQLSGQCELISHERRSSSSMRGSLVLNCWKGWRVQWGRTETEQGKETERKRRS